LSTTQRWTEEPPQDFEALIHIPLRRQGQMLIKEAVEFCRSQPEEYDDEPDVDDDADPHAATAVGTKLVE